MHFEFGIPPLQGQCFRNEFGFMTPAVHSIEFNNSCLIYVSQLGLRYKCYFYIAFLAMDWLHILNDDEVNSASTAASHRAFSRQPSICDCVLSLCGIQPSSEIFAQLVKFIWLNQKFSGKHVAVNHSEATHLRDRHNEEQQWSFLSYGRPRISEFESG
jgi:hypothetical protein